MGGSIVGFAAIIAVATATPGSAAQCCVERPAATSLKTEVVASGLEEPWGMAFLPDGSILVTERPGALRRVVDGVVSEPFSGLPAIGDVGQGGLLDIAIDPDFAETQTIFFSFAEPSEDGGTYGTAVARARIDLAAGRLDDVTTIFTSNKKSSGGRHFGSRIRIAADKTLFVTLGERGSQMRAQDPFDHAGSVIRINRDGSVPADNPFADGRDAAPEIWSIGHRNPQGAAIHPETGELWTLAHGARGGDEINKPEAGRNHGWPLISYGENYSGAPFAQGSEAEGLEQPIFYWDPSIAPSGFAFYSHPAPLIPDWQGSLLAGALKAQYLSRLVLEGETVVAEERYLVDTFGRIRDVRTGPDGAVWLLTDATSGELIRVTQDGG
ncbi:MAG: PQQ-dependent sugar dehydrogenase [Hyphomicrobiales bacterium]|nr:PQQ-dependent sugar dehydrogenase [Hyphomicrobiales bacterium]